MGFIAIWVDKAIKLLKAYPREDDYYDLFH